MSDKKVFAERLKAKRHEKQMSQTQLAKAIQVAASAISNYERGVVFPDICIAEKMSRFFGVSIEWLIGVSDAEMVEADETAVFLKEFSVIVDSSYIDESDTELAVVISKGTPLADFVADHNFIRSYRGALSGELKQYVQNNAIEHYSKFSVEDLLKEKTSQHEQP